MLHFEVAEVYDVVVLKTSALYSQLCSVYVGFYRIGWALDLLGTPEICGDYDGDYGTPARDSSL